MPETLQIRVSEEEQKRFKTIAEQLEMKHGEALTTIMNTFQMDKVSKANPRLELDITKFLEHMAQIQRLFTNLAESLGQQHDLARENVRHELESKDQVIADLQKRTELAEAAAKDAEATKKRLMQTEKDLEEARRTIEALTLIRNTMPDPEEYKQQAERIVALEAASAEKDKLIEKLLSGRQTEEE